MRRFLQGLVCGLLLVALGVALAASLWIWNANRAPSVAQGSVLWLRFGGSIPEREPPQFVPFGPPEGWTVQRLWDTLRKAAADKRIGALVIEPASLSVGWATLAELRQSIAAFAATGRPVAAYLRTPGVADYYVATAATRIVAPPDDLLDLKGLKVEMLYLRAGLDKLGILPEFDAIGDYKDAPDMFTRKDMSIRTREETNALLDARYRALVSVLASSRHKPHEEVRRLLDEGPFLSGEARQAGLLDDIAFEDGLRAWLARQLNQRKLVTVEAAEYQRYPARKLGLSGGPKVAWLVAEGDIIRWKAPGASVVDPDRFIRTVQQLRGEEDIAGVILRINSPGGDALASKEMLHEVRLLAKQKPVIVSFADIAASAGYELGLGGKRIVAYPETVTGSIGIFYGKFVLQGLYEKLGIHKEILQRGQFAAIDTEARPMTHAERDKLHSSLRKLYDSFVHEVAEARRRPAAEIEPLAQGRVWLGADALAKGLVDETGGIAAAIAAMKKELRLDPADTLELVVTGQRTWFEELQSLQAAGIPGLRARLWKRLPPGQAVP